MALETLHQSWSFYVVVKVYNRSVHRRIRRFVKFSSVKILNEPGYLSPDTQWWIFVVEVRLRPEWLPSQRDASDSDVLLRQLLAADLRDACEGSLPRNLERQHNIHVEGTLVLESQSGGKFGYFIKSRMVAIASSYW